MYFGSFHFVRKISRDFDEIIFNKNLKWLIISMKSMSV